jgi:hypothetical protein
LVGLGQAAVRVQVLLFDRSARIDDDGHPILIRPVVLQEVPDLGHQVRVHGVRPLELGLPQVRRPGRGLDRPEHAVEADGGRLVLDRVEPVAVGVPGRPPDQVEEARREVGEEPVQQRVGRHESGPRPNNPATGFST